MRKTILSLITFLIVGFSCTKLSPCYEAEGIETSSSLVITPYNKTTSEWIFPGVQSRSIYKKDSLKVYTEDGRRWPFVTFSETNDPANTVNSYYYFSISPLYFHPEDLAAFDREHQKKVYLNYGNGLIDTLTAVFKASKNKCDHGYFEYLKIYQKDRLLPLTTDKIYAEITLNY